MVNFLKSADKDIMEKAIREYTRWAAHELPDDLREELETIKGDERAVYDRFCKDLTFGTSGLRGKMGAGSNMINSIVLKRATDGVCDYLLSKHERPRVVVSYDTRINSMEYAEIVAEELAENGVEVMIFAEPTPVPVLSFAIRELASDSGIMITASHNPREYNGYKVYDHFGNQIDDKKARLIEEYIEKRDYFGEDVKDRADKKIAGRGEGAGNRAKEPGRENRTRRACPAEIKILDSHIKNAYLKALKEQVLLWTDESQARKELSQLSVVYTPLNGSGRDYVMEVARALGISDFTMVEEQSFWDGNFPTCPYPNPEYDEVFDLAIEKYCGKDTDIIVATDPDSDRMGVMARWQGGFRRLTGNQVGVLMLDYICHCLSVAGAEARATAASALPGSTGRQLAGKIAYKSYVSSPMAEDVARYYGVEMKNVPTGFKNIAAEMERLKSSGHETDFLFGFEESLGYLYGNYTRDKDGVLAVQMICLMAACLKAKGKTLFDKMEELYVRHGYSKSLASSVHFESEMDRENIDMLMKSLFSGQLESLMGQALECDFSGADMSLFSGALPCGDKTIVRPSGTEMKVKIYVYAKSDSGEKAEEKAKRMLSESEAFVQDFCGGRNLAERRYALKIDTKAKKGIL